MKKLMIVMLAIAALTLAGSLAADAQTPKRIQFAKGKSSAIVKGTTGKFGTSYAIRARSGQKLVIDVTPASGIGVKVETVGRFGHMVLLREENGGRFEVGLEETGDYTIFLGSLNGNSAAFTLTVQVKKLADI